MLSTLPLPSCEVRDAPPPITLLLRPALLISKSLLTKVLCMLLKNRPLGLGALGSLLRVRVAGFRPPLLLDIWVSVITCMVVLITLVSVRQTSCPLISRPPSRRLVHWPAISRKPSSPSDGAFSITVIVPRFLPLCLFPPRVTVTLTSFPLPLRPRRATASPPLLRSCHCLVTLRTKRSLPSGVVYSQVVLPTFACITAARPFILSRESGALCSFFWSHFKKRSQRLSPLGSAT